MASETNHQGPLFVQFFAPILQALDSLGGSARPGEVRAHIAESLGISDSEQEETTSSGTPRFANRVGWAKFYLVKAGLVDNSKRGVWTLTEEGEEELGMSPEKAFQTFSQIHSVFQESKQRRSSSQSSGEDEETAASEGSEVGTYREEALTELQAMPPEGFERFCQRLLRESGFQAVEVTGKSGDGGIDGIGILQVNTLVSFKVLFQCKRYQGTVGASEVRDFRGAMSGRADKGIFLTTGTFSQDARREAVRDGVAPIEMVDGEKLVDMLEELELGLNPVQSFTVERSFFQSFHD